MARLQVVIGLLMLTQSYYICNGENNNKDAALRTAAFSSQAEGKVNGSLGILHGDGQGQANLTAGGDLTKGFGANLKTATSGTVGIGPVGLAHQGAAEVNSTATLTEGVNVNGKWSAHAKPTLMASR